MRLEDEKRILMVQALEEADTREELVSSEDKEQASRLAGAPLSDQLSRGDENVFFARRASALISSLANRFPVIAAWATPPSHNRFGIFSWVIMAGAAVIGFLSNELVPEKRINILAFPLIGIIAWSLFVYLAEIVMLFRKRPHPPDSGPVSSLMLFLTRPFGKRRSPSPPETDPPEDIVDRARQTFQKNWSRFILPLWVARSKTLLHITAMILAGTAIAGMYVKGLANEYLAVWESTFFENGDSLRPFLNVILGPAADVWGSPLPQGAELEAIHLTATNGAEVGQNAAYWIHLYAITIAIYVLIPRFFLAAYWRAKASRQSRHIPFRSASPHYFYRLIAVSSGKSLPITVLPYAHDPSERIRRNVLRKTENLFSRPIALHWEKPVPFGGEDDYDPGSPEEEGGIMLLFNLASTPERETHLALFRSLLKIQHTDRRHVLLDAEAFDQKASAFSDGEKRREERIQSWKSLFSGENCDIHVISA